MTARKKTAAKKRAPRAIGVSRDPASTVLFRSPDRDAVHQRQATEIQSGAYPLATCTEDAYEVTLWSQEPTAEEVETDSAMRAKAR